MRLGCVAIKKQGSTYRGKALLQLNNLHHPLSLACPFIYNGHHGLNFAHGLNQVFMVRVRWFRLAHQLLSKFEWRRE
jgi:hypothetical protein